MPKSDDDSIRERGCGMPRVGQMYFSIPSHLGGVEIYEFLICPTIPVPEHLSIPDMGMLFVPRGEKNSDGKDIYDVFDHIGSGQYPNVWDWIEEVAQLGFHQLISTKSPIKLLTRESLYFGVHDRAGLEDPAIVQPILHVNLMEPCKKHGHGGSMDAKLAHGPYQETCIEFLTNTILKGEETEEVINDTSGKEYGLVVRKMPSFSYLGYEFDEGAFGKLEFVRSIFIKLPIGQMADLVFYTDGQDETNDKINSVIKPDCMDLRVVEVKK